MPNPTPSFLKAEEHDRWLNSLSREDKDAHTKKEMDKKKETLEELMMLRREGYLS